jgi:hypothetical protein
VGVVSDAIWIVEVNESEIRASGVDESRNRDQRQANPKSEARLWGFDWHGLDSMSRTYPVVLMLWPCRDISAFLPVNCKIPGYVPFLGGGFKRIGRPWRPMPRKEIPKVELNRRNLLKAGAAAASAPKSQRVLGANDGVGVAVVRLRDPRLRSLQELSEDRQRRNRRGVRYR